MKWSRGEEWLMMVPDIGESVFFPPFDTCPGCRGAGLTASASGDQTKFFCPACTSCWHVDLGWVHRVDPDEPAPAAAD
jgi:hypothetical protein